MTSPTIGEVFVDVNARTTNFWPQFVAQTAPGAAAAGATLGGAIGAAMAARIRAAVNGAMSGLGPTAAAHGAAAGNRFGGTFATTAEARIRAALRSLPEYRVNINARATDAERKMRELRDQLEALSRQRIGIDISEEAARAEVRRLKEELDRLAQTAASARVRIDSGNASLELRRLEEELNRLDGRRANARVDVDDPNTLPALSRMNALISLGLTLGPAIVPGAAAAAGAIGGIGLAAVSAAPAVGVLALAFGGIGSAVKALGAADRDAAKSANTGVQQNKSLASSADQVATAVRSLANARANAADQQRRSLQQIADAERQVGQAQREALRAQDALNDARESERRSQEDTAFQLRQNAIDQRRAAAEVRAAAAAAARTGGQQAKDDLEEAILRQEELRVAGERLTAEQQKNAETGVEGSKRVVAAQESVAESQQRIVDAERGVTEARRQAASQARQSASQIAAAQQAVAAAQRSAGAALSATSSTAGAAVDKLNDELASLPVTGQAFARFLFSLRPELAGLREAAADGLLPGAQAGIVALLPYLKGLRGFVRDVADELGNTAERAGEALTAPFWRQFFNYIGNDAVPVLRGLATVSGNVIEGFAGMLLGFQPFERQFGGGLIRASERFLTFSRTIETNRTFQNFVSYALTEGPRVVAMLGAFVDAGVRIGRAYAPVGSIVVGVLRAIADTLDAIPLPVLTALVTGLTAYKVATLAAAGIQGILNSSLLTGTARMITFGTATTTAGVTTTAATRALTAMQGVIGGPFVLALTAAAATIGYLVLQQQKARQEADAAKQSLQDYAGTFKDGVTPAALESSKAILAQNAGLRGIVDQTRAAGIATSTLIAGLNGDRDARNQVVAALDAQIAKSEEQSRIFGQAGAGQQQAAKAASDHAAKLKGLRDAFVASNDAASESAQLTGDLAAEQNKANDVFDDSSPTVRKLADSYRTLADSTSTAADKARALKDAEDALYGAARDADEAAEAQAKAIRNTNALLDERGKITDEGSKKLDFNTEAGARLRDSLKDQLAAINATYRANVANGKSLEEATKQHDEEVAALKRNATQHGVNAKAVDDLIKIYGQVPTSANTAVTISGMDGTKQQLDELLAYQYALRNGISLGEAKDKLNPQVKVGPGKGNSRDPGLAEGGPVVGPGTGTSDSVPAMERRTGAPFWLSNGEFVQPTASVDYYGQGFMEALRQRRIPRSAANMYAAGGLIDQILRETYPFPTDVSKTKIPTRADVAAAVYGSGFGFPPWPSSPSASRGDSGVWKSIVALIKSTGPLSGEFGNSYRPGDPLWHGCVPMDTRILTKRGWLSYDEVVIGEDETVGYNPATGKNEWTLIVALHKYFDAEVWKLQNKWFTAEVTPGHKWLVDDPKTVQTETVCTECGREFVTGRGMTTHRGHVHKVYTPRAKRIVEDLVETRHLRSDNKLHLSKPADLGGQLPITDDEAELIGWIFADGYMEAYGPTIVQSKPEEVQYLRGFMAKFPHSVYRRPPTGRQNFEVFRFGLAWEYWQDLSSRSKASKAEALNFVLSLSVSQRRAFVRGFLSADGNRDPRTENERLGYAAFQVSGPVAEAIKVAAYLEGYRPDTRIKTEFDKDRFGTQPLEHIGFRMPTVRWRKLDVVDRRTADVWCPTTTLGTWTARQAEEIFLTGNSGRAVDWMGYQQDALATFLSRQRPLELIHRTKQRDYAYTRGVNKGSFNNSLMEAHRNHIHIAMRDGGVVNSLPFGVYDSGGYLPQGLSLAYNGIGRPEPIPNPQAGSGGDRPNITIPVYGTASQSVTELAKAVAAELAWQMR